MEIGYWPASEEHGPKEPQATNRMHDVGTDQRGFIDFAQQLL
jgi:hypothetical protein